DVIVWVGPYLEAFMKRPLQTLGLHARNLQLMSVPGITLLELRKGGVWETDEDEGSQQAPSTGSGEEGAYNAHIWLDPENAETIVRTVANGWAEEDRAQAPSSPANAERRVQRLHRLEDELESKVAPIRDRPFIVSHDAYQYFDRRYRLNAVGSITTVPQAQP